MTGDDIEWVLKCSTTILERIFEHDEAAGIAAEFLGRTIHVLNEKFNGECIAVYVELAIAEVLKEKIYGNK